MSTTLVHRGVSIAAVIALIGALMLVVSVRPALAVTADLTATLSGDQEVPPVDTAATGTASVSIDTEAASGSQLCYDVTSNDLEGGAVVGAHIHEGAAGANGPVVVTLQAVIDGNGTGSGCATDGQIDFGAAGDPDIETLLEDIAANPQNYYINIHTEANMPGEIRGQLAATGGGTETGDVVVMKHLCNPDIQSVADFEEVEAAGVGGVTAAENPVAGLVATVLACPTIILPGDTPAGGAITGGNVAFEFSAADSASAMQTLSADANFEQAALCESDVNLDANGDGEISDGTCLDVSMYAFAGVAEGAVTVTETDAPGDSRFGTLRLTPGSGDDMAVLSAGNGVIELDTSADPDNSGSNPLGLPEYGADRVTLHVYNFQAAAAATPAPTAAASAMPDAAAEAAGSTGNLPVLAIGALLILVSVAAISARRSEATVR